MAVKSADHSPFREQFRLALETARLPVFRQVVLIRVVFGEPAARGMDIPEIRGGDRVPPWAKLRLPALSTDVQPSTEDFVDVTDGERYMVQLGSARGTLEKEEVVVLATPCTSHEGAVLGIAVGNLKAQYLRVKCFGLSQVRDKQHHMAHVDRGRSFVNGAWRIHPLR